MLKSRPGILDIKPYIGGEGRAGAGVTRLARLASNENPLGCSEAAHKAYIAAAGDIHRYPDGAVQKLRAALGEEYKMDAARIVCTAGLEEMISLLIRAYAGPGDEVIHSQYGFAMYPIMTLPTGATPVMAPEKNLRTDIDAVLAAVTAKTKIVLLANPNNPTGSYLTSAEMKRLCEKLPPHVLLVIDSAYAEFVEAADYDDGRALVDAYPNVVMLRTFSKVYGLAGLRLGWGYFPPAVADVLNRVREPFNVNVPAQAAGIAALADKDFVRRSVALARDGRIFLTGALTAMGLTVYPSVTNFLLVKFGAKAEDIRLSLRDQGVFVRQMGAYGLPETLRISIGTAEDNSQLISALKGILSA